MTYHHLGQMVSFVPNRLKVLIEAQGNLCAGCGKPMLQGSFRDFHPDRPTTDHVICINRGGPNRRGNIVAMHKLCNSMKGDDWPTGCECIWLIAVNCRLGYEPQTLPRSMQLPR